MEARLAPLAYGLRTDASPYGFGAILFELSSGKVVGYWADGP